jgi:hypothetical protein
VRPSACFRRQRAIAAWLPPTSTGGTCLVCSTTQTTPSWTLAKSSDADGATVVPGDVIGYTLTVTNTGSAACNRDVGAGANELRITSGSVLVWSSDFCNPSKAKDIQALEPGKPFTTSATWPGKITKKGCPADQPTAQAGGYKVVARNGAVESEPVAFAIQ